MVPAAGAGQVHLRPRSSPPKADTNCTSIPSNCPALLAVNTALAAARDCGEPRGYCPGITSAPAVPLPFSCTLLGIVPYFSRFCAVCIPLRHPRPGRVNTCRHPPLNSVFFAGRYVDGQPIRCWCPFLLYALTCSGQRFCQSFGIEFFIPFLFRFFLLPSVHQGPRRCPGMRRAKREPSGPWTRICCA